MFVVLFPSPFLVGFIAAQDTNVRQALSSVLTSDPVEYTNGTFPLFTEYV